MSNSVIHFIISAISAIAFHMFTDSYGYIGGATFLVLLVTWLWLERKSL